MKIEEIARGIADDCIGVRVRMLNRIVTRIYDDALRPLGVRFSQLNILTVIALEGPMRASEIGPILALEKSTLSRNLRLMEENGWLESLPDDDGRGQLIRLTREGKSLYRKAAAAWNKAQQQLQELLGSHTAGSIGQAVERFRDDK